MLFFLPFDAIFNFFCNLNDTHLWNNFNFFFALPKLLPPIDASIIRKLKTSSSFSKWYGHYINFKNFLFLFKTNDEYAYAVYVTWTYQNIASALVFHSLALLPLLLRLLLFCFDSKKNMRCESQMRKTVIK